MIDTGSGPPLLLIPGIQGRWEWMKPTVDALSANWRVVTSSLPGEPGTPPTEAGDLDFDSFVRHLDGVLDRAGIQSAVVCGVSFGGLIALRYAASRHERVRGLILVSAPGPHWRLPPQMATYLRWPTLSSPLFFAGALNRFWPELRVTIPEMGARMSFCAATVARVITAPAIPARMSGRARLAAAESFEGDCERVSVPTLVIAGERHLDRVVQHDDTMQYVALIRGARFRLFEQTGHLGIVSAPQRFATMVSTFLDD